MDKIQVIVKNTYGNKRIYPNCAISRAFTELTNTKTLSLNNLKTIKALGYDIEVTQDSKILELLNTI